MTAFLVSDEGVRQPYIGVRIFQRMQVVGVACAICALSYPAPNLVNVDKLRSSTLQLVNNTVTTKVIYEGAGGQPNEFQHR